MELGLRGSVIIALRIPHMLLWDSGGCHHRPQDPSSATLGLRRVSLSPSGSLICYNGHSDYPLWSVTLHQNSLREVTIYARKKMIKDILSLNYLLRRKREIREQYKKCLCLERSWICLQEQGQGLRRVCDYLPGSRPELPRFECMLLRIQPPLQTSSQYSMKTAQKVLSASERPNGNYTWNIWLLEVLSRRCSHQSVNFHKDLSTGLPLWEDTGIPRRYTTIQVPWDQRLCHPKPERDWVARLNQDTSYIWNSNKW